MASLGSVEAEPTIVPVSRKICLTMPPRANLSVPDLRPAARNWSRSETAIVLSVPWMLIGRNRDSSDIEVGKRLHPGPLNCDRKFLKQITFLDEVHSRSRPHKGLSALRASFFFRLT